LGSNVIHYLIDCLTFSSKNKAILEFLSIISFIDSSSYFMGLMMTRCTLFSTFMIEIEMAI